jgi:hypothetical protein
MKNEATPKCKRLKTKTFIEKRGNPNTLVDKTKANS